MRSIPDTLHDALNEGAARLCHVWLLTRNDGETLGFTDHDRDLVFQGVTCRADSGWTAGASRAVLGDETGDKSVSGVLSADSLDAVALRAGSYDDARIDAYVVDWAQPDQFVQMATGRFGRIEARGGIADGGAFVVHVEGPAAGLQRVIGRRYTPLCDAVLGDARCGVSDTSEGCDKRYATCRDRFDNVARFRGFPDMPGEDFITLYPRSTDRLDGTSSGSGGRS
ncbi:MAG: DUF2163 domain-containing protein [Asticcacaulis sp.]